MRTTTVTTWDECFFGIARTIASRSKDPSTQNGAVIVTPGHIVVGLGYNGLIRGIKDTPERWEKPGKYLIVVHAEPNAIDNANGPVDGCTMYIWSSRNYISCKECAKTIAHNGIVEVKVMATPSANTPEYSWDDTLKIFDLTGVKLTVCSEVSMDNIVRKVFKEI